MEAGGRFAPHLALEAIGTEGQGRIQQSKVQLIGLGGLGCPVAQYLAASGVGELLICDFDRVSETNLARQLLYTPEDIDRLKVEVAQQRLQQLNPELIIETHQKRVDDEFLESAVVNVDLVIDASDNYGTRLMVNRVCQKAGTPWVMGSCIRFEGQLMFIDPGNPELGCYRCAYGHSPETLEDCPGAGIFAPVAGMTGTSMAQLALARLAGLKVPEGLHLLDARQLFWKTLRVQQNPDCPACLEN
jgi:molybdopterin/thiamine biosynthesis adenylyltransferase